MAKELQTPPQIRVVGENYAVPAHWDLEDDDPDFRDEICDLTGLSRENNLTQALEILLAGIYTVSPENERRINYLLTVLYNQRPRNFTEAMLVVQMSLSHEMALSLFHKASRTKFDEEQERHLGLALRLSRNMNSTAETLSKLRRNGEQKMRIEHVTIENGGQAILGSVGGGDAKN